MSKTKGNVIDPLDLIEQFGTDSLRFFLASNISPHSDIKLAKNSLEPARNFMNKIWNANKFVKFHTKEKPNENLELTNFYDAWIVDKFSELIESYQTSINNCEIEKASGLLYKFFWDDFCDWYIEIVKVEFELNSKSQNSKNIISNILNDFLILLYPFCPFISSEILSYHSRNIKEMLIFPKNPNYVRTSTDDFERLQDFVVAVRSLRKNLSIPPQHKITVYVDDEDNFLNTNLKFLKKLAGINEIVSVQDSKAQFVTNVSKFYKVSFELNDTMNIEEQKAKLLKDLSAMKNDYKKSDAKLRNNKFMDSAPEDVILREKRILKESTEHIENLENILNQLK
jgi:valyl-tRNA synthetase